MKVINGSNFGSTNLHNYQVIVSDELKKEELDEQDLEEIVQKFNGPSGEISLRLFYLRRNVQLKIDKGHLTGFVLYMSQDSFTAIDWVLIENDIKSVLEQIEMVVAPYK